MVHIVKTTHEIIDLAGKLDWQAQRGTTKNMNDVIKKLRIEINKAQHFINTHEVIE